MKYVLGVVAILVVVFALAVGIPWLNFQRGIPLDSILKQSPIEGWTYAGHYGGAPDSVLRYSIATYAPPAELVFTTRTNGRDSEHVLLQRLYEYRVYSCEKRNGDIFAEVFRKPLQDSVRLFRFELYQRQIRNIPKIYQPIPFLSKQVSPRKLEVPLGDNDFSFYIYAEYLGADSFRFHMDKHGPPSFPGKIDGAPYVFEITPTNLTIRNHRRLDSQRLCYFLQQDVRFTIYPENDSSFSQSFVHPYCLDVLIDSPAFRR